MARARDEIHGSARMVIREGKLEEFKRLAAQCVEIVRTKDSGTIEYDLFLNADGTVCFVHERYRDSAAGLEHMANIGPMMEPLSEVCTVSGEICGTPSPELRQALEAAGVTIYEPLVRLRR
ncbi:putative quinol monooxygenase [Solicola sp. PLA-1-18]|uniref:putative quinol monooxygenase n=1 Tax=Solicola sp. PLA-1-18 TaxID=3380532 RepID=UPI003B823331